MKKQKVKYIKLREEFNPATQKYEPVLPLVNEGKNTNQQSKKIQFKIPRWWPLLLLIIILLIVHYILMYKFEGNSNLQMPITIIVMVIILILLSIITYLSFKKKA